MRLYIWDFYSAGALIFWEFACGDLLDADLGLGRNNCLLCWIPQIIEYVCTYKKSTGLFKMPFGYIVGDYDQIFGGLRNATFL